MPPFTTRHTTGRNPPSGRPKHTGRSFPAHSDIFRSPLMCRAVAARLSANRNAPSGPAGGGIAA